MLVSFPFHSDVDNAIIRPLPRAKRTLSEPNILPHMVQLLLTFDPRLVEKVVTLLNSILEVGPHTALLSLSLVEGGGRKEDGRMGRRREDGRIGGGEEGGWEV